ncbi:MAG: lysophospholipid acyltransferase family protein [Desulfobacterales bacterium]|nr:lysophospholipid acyltransferase family protein [Desulfobacterales bacterium]
MGNFFKHRFVGRWPARGAKILWLLSRLVRTKTIGIDQIKSLPKVIFAHWHGDEIALLPRLGNLGITILVSHSKDGEIMAKAAWSLGYRITRGSSSRGAAGGLLALVKAVRDGHNAGLAVDGPRGPRGKCKPGVVRLAQKTGVPLFPIGVAASRKFVFKKTWNQAYLPLPFARQVFFFDKPMYFQNTTDADSMGRHCRLVEEALCHAHDRSEVELTRWMRS